MSEQQWLMRIEGGLNAHFKQPDGSSRPGTDWAVGLKHGEETCKVFVRAYLSDDLAKRFRKDTEYQTQTVLGYVNDCLNAGWHPTQEKPLTITILNPKDMPPEKKSRWKFW
jgi:hypothetical protein